MTQEQKVIRAKVGVLELAKHQMVGSSLAGGIGRVRRIGGCFCEKTFIAKRAGTLRRWKICRSRNRSRFVGDSMRQGRKASCNSVKVPTVLVRINSPGPSIERSTWLSAARSITASGWYFSNSLRSAGPSQMHCV